MRWFVWAIVLLIQAGSSTWASRARNTASLRYHGVAAIFSHGVWFISQVFMLDTVVGAARAGAWPLVIGTGLFYTTFSVLGSILGHWVSARYFERGKARIGTRHG